VAASASLVSLGLLLDPTEDVELGLFPSLADDLVRFTLRSFGFCGGLFWYLTVTSVTDNAENMTQ
jgi:hypothetical protein